MKRFTIFWTRQTVLYKDEVIKILRSTLFEAFTHSNWVEKNYELFWITYLVLIWIVPKWVVIVDPYALSIVPLIGLIEIGFSFFNMIVESFGYYLARALKKHWGAAVWAIFFLPFLVVGIFLIYYSGSYFTTIVYFLLIFKTLFKYLEADNDGGGFLIPGIFRGTTTVFTFMLCFFFVLIDWPMLGLAEVEVGLSGGDFSHSGLLADYPHRGVPTGMIAYGVLWYIKKKGWVKKGVTFISGHDLL